MKAIFRWMRQYRIDRYPVIDGPAIMIGVAEKGYATLKVTAKAAGGHSSMPPAETGVGRWHARSPRSPIDRSRSSQAGSDDAAALAAEKGGTTKMAVANPWLFGPILKSEVAGTPSTAAAFRTTIAPTMLEGSPKENVLPQTANALINYRIAPWNRSTDIMARAKDAVGDLPVELAWVKAPREPSRVSSTNSQGWKWIAAAARADAPDAVLSPILVVGSTDSRNMEPVSEDVYRFMPMHFSLRIGDDPWHE